MGKIFKALEKAAKEDPDKVVVKPSSPKREKTGPVSKAGRQLAEYKPVKQPKREAPLSALTPMDKHEQKPQVSDDAALTTEVRAPAEENVAKPSIAAVEPPSAVVEPEPAHPKMKAASGEESHERELPMRPVEPEFIPEQVPARETDAVNLSIVDHDSNDQAPANRQAAGEAAAGKEVRAAAEPGAKRVRKGVNVRYSRTKVQFNDPEKLKNNRVLSVFDDIDTANQFKILRTQILRKLKETGGNSILVTSANPWEGKTFTSINLGISIAKEFDRTVLIVDADIRRPAQGHTDFSTEFFSLKVEKGLTDYLLGDADIEEVLINPGIDKLTLIPGGTPVDNSPELLNSPVMEQMMDEIKSRYASDRLVIIDGPALLPFPDAMILSRYVDGVLPVIEAEKTSTADLRKMMKHLKEVNMLGLVLNKNRA